MGGIENMLKKSPVCKQCGQPIWDNYVNALGATWHPEHFVCAYCGKPITDSSFTVQDGKPYHVACYQDHIVPKCVYCGRPLLGEYLVDGWGNKFHKEHQSQYPHCAYCGRLVLPRQQEHGARASEQVRCPVCRAAAIETSEEAQPLFDKLKRWVGSQGLRYNNLRLSLELVGRPKLAQYLSVRNEVHSLGVTMSTTYSTNGQVTHTVVDRVAVLQGMPSLLFQGVTMHELGHVWLTVQSIQDLPQWAEEGFCELLSHRYLSGINTQEGQYYSQRIEKNTDPVYGEGFRRIKAIADRVGFQRFIEQLQRTKQLPR